MTLSDLPLLGRGSASMPQRWCVYTSSCKAIILHAVPFHLGHNYHERRSIWGRVRRLRVLNLLLPRFICGVTLP